MKQVGSDVLRPPQEIYERDILPGERSYAAQQMGRLGQTYRSQGAAAQATNQDLARRLGLGATYAQDVSHVLDASLAESLSQAAEERRLQVMQEIENRRRLKLEEALAEQQRKIEAVRSGVAGVSGIVGAGAQVAGGILSAVGGQAGAIGGGILAGAGTATTMAGSLGSQAAAAKDVGLYGGGASRRLRNTFTAPSTRPLVGSSYDAFAPYGSLSGSLGGLYDDEEEARLRAMGGM